MLSASVLSAWLQFTASGPQVRAVATGGCPAATVDGRSVAMAERSAPSAPFPNAVCSAPVPAGARTVRVEERTVAAPAQAAQPNTIVAFGDSGCRIEGAVDQACNDPAQWPFPQIARTIAAMRPDLIIDVGDYYYRESPCLPLSGCTGSPHGDNAASWDADWFAPAAPLFAAAPLILARGNHENCDRGGQGWFRYLDAFASTACVDVTPPYAVRLGGLDVVVHDSAGAADSRPDAAAVERYRATFASARQLASGDSWLVTHRPPYANATERAAMGSNLAPFEAVLSGHIHTFAAIDVAGEPPLVLNGTGGDLLDLGEARFLGFALGDLRATRAPYVDTRFGFVVYRRAERGWSVSLRNPDGSERAHCTLGSGNVQC